MNKYESIANLLKQHIRDNTYPIGSLLPSQTDLADQFQVSRMTINKAINILTMEGFVSAQRGFGTKIMNRPFWNKNVSPVDQYNGLSAEMRQLNRPIESQIIDFNVDFPDADEQEHLTLTAQQPIYRIIRLRLVDHEPYLLEHTIMPVELVPNLTDEILHHSIYDYLQNKLGLQIAGAYRNIQAAKPDELDMKYLKCQPDDPVLEVAQMVYLKNGQPFEYSHSRNRYDKRSFTELNLRK
ncbi:GntR family transcriptional regulator [Lapidilactobacillus mulanensis]|uniref:GntR family transcriptional regulator n=1 Tax=Lapidilactobacillus mulanensis TaxID=2485999 RepID=A0ABW4DQ07_9LACO|nr:GntR family transcriptional regulator [Lapidilactobacillus mulanensis]